MGKGTDLNLNQSLFIIKLSTSNKFHNKRIGIFNTKRLENQLLIYAPEGMNTNAEKNIVDKLLRKQDFFSMIVTG